MTFKRYFSKDFPKDLGALQLSPVPRVLKDIFHDPDLLCFGGKDWKHVAQDLELIAVHDRPRFVLSLLAMVLTDQCMQTYFKSSYATWRAQTNYPKFAWMRFGLYNENPLKLLAMPERAGLLPVAQTLALMPEFVSFYLELVADYLKKNMPQVAPEAFFKSVFKDGIMQLDDGVVLAAFKCALQQALQPASSQQTHMVDWAMA